MSRKASNKTVAAPLRSGQSNGSGRFVSEHCRLSASPAVLVELGCSKLHSICSRLPIIALLAISVSRNSAGSAFTLKQRVDACHSVLVVSIAKIVPPVAQTNTRYFAEATVLEVLKGPSELKQISFFYASRGEFAGPASKIASGKEYMVFLCNVNGNYWVFEGPAGLEPVSNAYQEKRLEGAKIIAETLSHTNYLKAIRSSAQPIKVSISQLLKRRREYFGKRVEVTGYYRSHFEYSGLYEKKEDMDRFVENPQIWGAIHDGLWIMPFSKPGFETKIHFVKEGWVRAIGVVNYNTVQQDLGVGHLNGWPAELIALELFEPVQ